MSVATHRNGTIRRSKSPPHAVDADAKSPVSARSICAVLMKAWGRASDMEFLLLTESRFMSAYIDSIVGASERSV